MCGIYKKEKKTINIIRKKKKKYIKINREKFY